MTGAGQANRFGPFAGREMIAQQAQLLEHGVGLRPEAVTTYQRVRADLLAAATHGRPAPGALLTHSGLSHTIKLTFAHGSCGLWAGAIDCTALGARLSGAVVALVPS